MEIDEIVGETAPETGSDCGSEGFVLEKVVASKQTNPLSYHEWINCLQGTPVGIPPNGQCLFLAFYATSINLQAQQLTLTSATVKAANGLKKQILDIVLANLRYDV